MEFCSFGVKLWKKGLLQFEQNFSNGVGFPVVWGV